MIEIENIKLAVETAAKILAWVIPCIVGGLFFAGAIFRRNG